MKDRVQGSQTVESYSTQDRPFVENIKTLTLEDAFLKDQFFRCKKKSVNNTIFQYCLKYQYKYNLIPFTWNTHIAQYTKPSYTEYLTQTDVNRIIQSYICKKIP